MELGVTEWGDEVKTEFGVFRPPAYALADIGRCMDGKDNCLIDYCVRRGDSPTLLLYTPKTSVLHREARENCYQRQYSFSLGLKVLSTESVDVPKRQRQVAAKKKTSARIPEGLPEAPTSSEDDNASVIVEEIAPDHDSASEFMEDSGDEDIEGGTVSEGEVIRCLRKPVLDRNQVFEMAQASVDRRYYFVIASRIHQNVIAHWYGSERRKLHKEYKRAVSTVKELKTLSPFSF